MRVHHLNCGTFCPAGGPVMDGRSRGLRGTLVCHCLLIEGRDGLALVDTGIGLRDVMRPHPRLSRLYATLLGIRFRREDTAVAQIEALGFAPSDVRHIVLTHLDFDHAGGLEDFPQAAVHVMAAEREASRRRAGFVASRRYRPEQWDEVKDWRLHRVDGETWEGFRAVRPIGGFDDALLLVPLEGHTHGHAGVAIQTERGWMLHAGDAYFHESEMDFERPRCPAGLRGYQALMEVDRGARLANQSRLRDLKRAKGGALDLFCAHDAAEFEARRGRS